MELVKVNASEYGLEEQKAKQIADMFKPMLDKMVELENEYNEIISLDIEPDVCAKAKELRNKYVKVRTGTAQIHKDLKAFYLKGGRFVDAWKNAQLMASGEKEDTLKSIENHFENLEKERIEKIRTTRWKQLEPYVEIEPSGLGEMSEEVWVNFLSGSKQNHALKAEAEKKAEEERKLSQMVAERISYANQFKDYWDKDYDFKSMNDIEYLDVISELKHKRKLKLEQQEAERLKRIELENELEAKRKQELAEEKAKLDAENKLKFGSDKVKLELLISQITSIKIPDVTSTEAKAIVDDVVKLLGKLEKFIRDKSGNM